MSLERVYLDYNATAPLNPAARTAMLAAMDLPGNASSVHAEGRAARRVIEDARVLVAGLLGLPSRQLTFVSGGTEAANLLLTPKLSDGGAPLSRLFVAAGEHACVLQGHRFAADRVSIVPLNAAGSLDLSVLAAMLKDAAGERVLLALQAVNNETGVIQPVAEAAGLVHAAGGLVVCDGVQGAGRLELSILGADAVFISSHKIGGPKGVGAFAFADPRLHIADPLLRGGGQERGLRAGTENIAAIAGFGVAAQLAAETWRDEMARLGPLRDGLEDKVSGLFPDAVFFGRQAPRVAQTSAFAVPGIAAETLLIALDLEGCALSSGSACSSGKVQPSHVLRAMGIEAALAKGALRVSLGASSDMTHVEAFCRALDKAIRNMRSRSVRTAA